jgi:TonB-linked SusC/RagA family outer membrane protein
MQLTYRSINQLLGDAGGAGSSDDENVLLDASRMSAIIPIYDEFGGYAGTAAPGFNNPRNPVATLDANKDDRSFSTALFGNLYAEFDPIENLTIRSSIGGNGGSFHFYGFNRRQYENSENNSAFGFNQGSGSFTSWVFTNTANYKVEAGKAKFDILVGQEALNTGKVRQITGSGIDPFSENVDFVNLSNVSGQVLNGFHTNGVTFASYFGRLNVEYDDKYILSAVVRRDGSSRFGAENRYGVFPAFSAAWRISSEAFMADQTLFEDLKLRGGWGVMGNSNNVDPNNQFSLFGTSLGASSYDIGGSNSTVAQGFYRTRVGNAFAKWERAVTANIGLDALMFDGKLDIGIELWSKNTEDLLFQQPVSVLTGPFAAAPSVNVGKMRNTGLDFSIVNKGKAGAVTYEVVLNGGFLNNEIVELAEGIENLPNRSASYRGITPVLNQVGSPLSSFFGYQVDGLFENQADVDNSPTQDGAAPGRFKFRDINGLDADGNLTGVPDGVIDIADRTVLGSPIPDFTGGLTLKLGYKNFGLDIYTFASIGNDVYNVSKLFTDFYPLFPGAAISERVKDSWTFDNTSGEIPIFENVSNFSTNTQSNSFYVEDGSYFRVQNVTLSYTLPANIIDRWNLSKLKVFMGVNNLLTITGYSGLDPSVGGAADTNFGIDLGNVPLTRSVTLGLNVDF